MDAVEKVAAAALKAPLSVTFVDGRVVIECNTDDARMIAAAAGDRARALDHAPKVKGSSGASERAWALLKRIRAELRAAGVIS